MKTYIFRQAVPVWEPGKDKVMNYNLVFRTVVPKGRDTTIAIAASNMYQMFVNGKMIGEGPARAGHGCYRVDETDITQYLTQDENIVAIYVDSYYVNNYYLIKQPGFLCAEVIAGESVLAATGASGFEAKYHNHRLRKVGRYSCQRTFSEVYTYDADYKAFETDINCRFKPICLAPVEPKKFIQREVPYPCYDYYSVQQTVSRGSFTYAEQSPTANYGKWITLTGTMTGNGFDISETECIVDYEIDRCICTASTALNIPFDATDIDGGEWVIFDFVAEKTGFINLGISVDKKAEIILSYDEILTDGDVNIKRFDLSGGIVLFLEPGVYNFISNEPVSMRYIKLANNSTGTATITKLGITEYAFDYKPAPLDSSVHQATQTAPEQALFNTYG